MLQAEISPSDALQADDRAIVNIPTFRTVRVAVFASSASPFAADLLSVLSSNPYVQAQILPPELSANVSPDIAIYQGANLPAQPDFNSIWFLSGPPVAGSKPLRVTGWNLQHPVTRWVRTHDISVRNPAALKVEPGDTVLAYTEGDSAGAADSGARTRRAQNSDHRLQSARFQFSAGVGVSVADGRERRVDDAFRRRSRGLALHGRDRSSRVRRRKLLRRPEKKFRLRARARKFICSRRKQECTGSSRPAAKRAWP